MGRYGTFVQRMLSTLVCIYDDIYKCCLTKFTFTWLLCLRIKVKLCLPKSYGYWCVDWSGKRFMCSRECHFGVNFPSCEVLHNTIRDSKVHGANMGPIWGLMLAIWTLLSGIFLHNNHFNCGTSNDDQSDTRKIYIMCLIGRVSILGLCSLKRTDVFPPSLVKSPSRVWKL